MDKILSSLAGFGAGLEKPTEFKIKPLRKSTFSGPVSRDDDSVPDLRHRHRSSDRRQHWPGSNISDDDINPYRRAGQENFQNMSRRDIYHDTVRRSLKKDGWEITHDPFPLEIGEKTLSADLGAERLVSAEKGSRKIVVEVRSFVGRSDVRDLQRAVGQYVMYLRILRKAGTDSHLYLAVRERTYETVFCIELGQLFLTDSLIRLIVFDDKKEVITKWIPD